MGIFHKVEEKGEIVDGCDQCEATDPKLIRAKYPLEHFLLQSNSNYFIYKILAHRMGKDTMVTDRIKRKPQILLTIVSRTETGMLLPPISHFHMASLFPTTDGVLIHVGKNVTNTRPH